MTELFDRETGEIIDPTPDSVLVCFALYQQEASKQKHWRAHRFLTDPIRKAIKARLAEGGGMESWREALGIASRSEFLQGNIKQPGKERFRMDLNFFTRPASYEKILSGFYSREPEAPPRIHIPTGGRTPQQAPAEPFIPESQDVRELAMIESYTKYGRYADANRIAQARADRLGVPAVLIPDPAVAHVGMPEKPSPSLRQPAQGRPVTDLPGWLDEDIPASAYGDGA